MPERVHGYMRVRPGTPDDEIEALQERMRRWASARGWELVDIHEETVEGSHAVLSEMTDAILRSGALVVLVPSYRHLGAHLVLQAHVVDHILHAADAEVRSMGAVR